jgi:rod shape-determining protein MreC
MVRFIWNNKFGKLILILLGCVAVFLWNPPFVAFSLRTAVGTVTFPFQNVGSFFGYHAGRIGSFLGSIGRLKQENERLLEENIDLKAEVAALADVSRENAALRTERGLAPYAQFELKAAEVMGRDDVSSGGAILLNVGELAGIRKGMAVVVGKGTLIGRVVETTPLASRVLLLSDSASAVNAVAGATEARGVVRGEYGLGLTLDMVLQSETLREGDEVITSGLGGEVPRGLLIGTITRVESSTDRLFQYATIASPIRFDRVRFVSVIIGTKS